MSATARAPLPFSPQMAPPAVHHRHLQPIGDSQVAETAAATAEQAALPPPQLALQRLALYTFEAVEGFRPLAQLGRLVSVDALETIRLQRSARVEQRTLCGDTRRIVPAPGTAHVNMPKTGVVESVVVLLAQPRAIAIAMRLEFSHGRWQATEVAVL